MKIRQPTHREDADTKSQVNRNQLTGSAADEAGEHAANRPVERDFASVLRQSVKPSRERFDEREDGKETRRASERRDAKSSASERERAVERRERNQDDSSGHGGGENSGGGGFSGRGGVADVVPHAGNVNARQILHVADLERIVAAVRTKLLADNRREVTIQLHRSVLAGLRVKVSRDESGRVTAEFIVASEAVRSQIEGRAPELAELLRGRGVNLAHIKTSIGDGEANGGSGSDDGRRGGSDERSEAIAAQSGATANSPTVLAGETGVTTTDVSHDATAASAAMHEREQATRYRA